MQPSVQVAMLGKNVDPILRCRSVPCCPIVVLIVMVHVFGSQLVLVLIETGVVKQEYAASLRRSAPRYSLVLGEHALRHPPRVIVKKVCLIVEDVARRTNELSSAAISGVLCFCNF